MAVVNEKMLSLGTRYHHHTQLLRQFQSHLRNTRTRQQHGYAHVRGFHYDFRGQATGGVKDLVVTAEMLQPHPAGYRVGCIVSSHVLYEDFYVRALA